MVSNNFRIRITIQVFGIAAVCLAIVYLLMNSMFYASVVVLLGLLAFLVWDLIHFVDRSNRDVAYLLESLRFEDFSQSFSTKGSTGSYKELRSALNEVMTEFGKARLESAEQHQYLQTIVKHTGIGLMAVRPDGEIELSNDSTCRLLGVSRLVNLDQLPDSLNDLVAAIRSIKSGEKAVVKIMRDQRYVQLSLSATELRQGSREVKLLSIQDISRELAEQEMEAWQRLTRVLSHEIMNSVTPISSLSATAHKLLSNTLSDSKQIDDEAIRNLQDVYEAMVTIEKRSAGLVNFVLAYRDLTRIAKPKFQIVRIYDLLARVKQLISVHELARDVDVHCSTDPDGLEITADPTQIEQVLINLAINSLQALDGHADGVIRLMGRQGESGRPEIEVIDNGPGIDPEAINKLFVPFFSTRPSGTGIGLALSQQIMRLHKGEIVAKSEPNHETTFTLRF